MKYEALRRVKRMREVGKVKGVSVVAKRVCVGCGCPLTSVNRSLDSHLCKNCFMVSMAEIEAEDMREDSLAIDELSSVVCVLCGCSLSSENRSMVENLCLHCFGNLKFGVLGGDCGALL